MARPMPPHPSTSTIGPVTVPLALALVEPTAWRLIADATHAADGASAHGHDGVAASGPAAGRIVAAVNFTAEPLTLGVPDGQPERATLVMSTDPDRAVGDADLRRFVLLPNEAVLLLMPV